MKKKDKEKIDNKTNYSQSERKKEYSQNKTHYKNNFLVCFCSGSDTVARATVNARDTTQALFLAIRALFRKGCRYNLTRVRIGAIYENKKSTIEKRIAV